MRILWVSDSPSSPSGFGGVTGAVCSRLAEHGHRVEILGWQTHGSTDRWQGIPVHPVRRDQFGSDVLLTYLMRLQPHFVITLGDVWWMSFLADPPVQRYLDLAGARWVMYYPIDGADRDGLLPKGWVRALRTADVRVAMSRFGAEVTRACGLDCEYIPHGCDLDVFRPPADKDEAKAELGYDGKFVILSDARNQPRKLLPRLFDVAAEFARGKPDVVLHLHADPEDDAASSDLYSYRLREDAIALGLEEVVRLTPNFQMRASAGLPLEELARLYAAADAHVLTSWGEGFGLPNLQAACAGVVPIAGAFAASRELVEGHGYAVSAESTMLDEFGLVRWLLDRAGTVAALEELYQNRALLAARSARSRDFALGYGWDGIVDDWEHALLTAPQRRRPTRTQSYEWVAGGGGEQLDGLPEPVANAATDVLATLPDGVSVSVRMFERRQGEVAAAIYEDAFGEGDELSVPVRLPPFFDGAPRPRVGDILVGPADLGLAAMLRRIFPRLAISVPTPNGDPDHPQRLSLEQLLPPLVHYALVLDYGQDATPGIDLACAALGIPFAGVSTIWPALPGATPFLQARRLLTDQGFSERRRGEAARRAEQTFGVAVIEKLRTLALAGQPDEDGDDAPAPAPPVEMFLVRAREGAPEDANETIAEYVSLRGGLILMATGADSLIVAMPAGGKAVLERQELVGFVGGIALDDEGKAARPLKALFAANAARQMIARGDLVAGGRR